MSASTLASTKSQSDQLPIPLLVKFFSIIACLKEHISWHQTHTATTAPIRLPHSIVVFSAEALDVRQDVVENTWSTLRDGLWGSVEAGSSRDTSGLIRDQGLLELFLTHGMKNKLGLHSILPPARVCLDSRCDTIVEDQRIPQALTKLEWYKATLFTKNMGPIPAWSASAACRKCNARYHADYYVHESGTLCTYYTGVIPHVIEVTKHCYVERSLCERFTNSMVTAWVSATNNARIYNLETVDRVSRLPRTWSHSLDLRTETVWDAFCLNGLILDYHERSETLELANDASNHASRLEPALQARNERMVGPGQELWNHACKSCCDRREINGIIEFLRSAVTDGISLGHPCCGIHDCKIPLPSQRHHHCTHHREYDGVCAIVGCSLRADAKHTTCSDPEHRKLEIRLSTAEITEVTSDDHPDKPDSGNVKLRARFGRRRTHNEQLCVSTCGVIFGRCGIGKVSEGVNGVQLFHQVLFPTKASLPGVIFYDNNCHMKAVINKIPDMHFVDCALPVDVFHMKAKHKEADNDCNRFCNPALFPSLMVGDKWRFNSSAAEITNAWFGGFQSMVREMRVDRYNFFLDEMIKRRNHTTVVDLESRHLHPYQIPRVDLLT
ncbi:hypothetical protein FIBSPDRAFT_724394 [Athelia psychrophila]|uniref:CxC6 like cysteine cluster associated with KDZ domain-containing protein n=1 Tax=Athelia psychrophila TaxID=1759441 RepID=A0A166U7U9_9AGAM|nr:hypothetical protein FIBSPDRAFT_724394 [Fibularhizoctonia sp. CBS 109695]